MLRSPEGPGRGASLRSISFDSVPEPGALDPGKSAGNTGRRDPGGGSICRRAGSQFVGPNLELLERVGSEGAADGRIGRVATASNQDPAHSGFVVPGVEGVPLSVEIGLEPASEIHRRVRRGDADVTEIARTVAGGDVHAAAERDRQMGKVAA